MDVVEDLKVACLYNVCDLQRVCQDNELKFSQDTNRFLLHLTVNKLGPLVAQKLVKNLVDKGEMKWDMDEGFEVETILDYTKDEEGKEFYHIKWKGWANRYNTWEPKEHLDCYDILETFHRNLSKGIKPDSTEKTSLKRRLASEDEQPDKRQRLNDLMERILKAPEVTPLTLLSQSPLKNLSNRFHGLVRNGVRPNFIRKKYHGDIYNKRTKSHKQLRAEVKLALAQWEKDLNNINTDPAPLKVENDVDLEGPPSTFTYIDDYKAGEGVTIPDDPIVGCECEDCFEEKKHCCGPNAGADFAYYKHSKVRVPPGTPIYECNKRCNCGPNCPNRVVQHGRKHRVCLFRTHNGRGWGVKALQKVKRGSFVMEYVGEVITNEEAERRGKVYDAEGRTYLFDLDYNDADCPFTVDAGFYGNVSHFVNHSCDPNLAVYGVWINHLDPRLPRIALFAKRDINKGEELTFDYMMTGDTTQNDLDELPQEKENLVDKVTVKPSSDINDSATKDSSFLPLSTPEADREIPPATESTFLLPEAPTSLPLVVPVNPSPAIDDGASDISKSTSEISRDTSDYSSFTMDAPNPFIRRKITSPSPAMKYRIMCQCGAKNCRKYLF